MKSIIAAIKAPFSRYADWVHEGDKKEAIDFLAKKAS